MPKCQQCQRNIAAAAAFCPYCGAANSTAAAPPRQQNNRVKITLIIAVTAVVVTAVILGGILIVNNLSRKKTFNLTMAQYTAQINSRLGKEMLDASKWTVNGAHAVYHGDGFTIDLDTDLDSQLVKKVSISPPDNANAQLIIQATVSVCQTSNYTTINNYVVFDADREVPATVSTAATQAITTAPPQTEHTALSLINKDLAEIAALMGNDYHLERKLIAAAAGTTPDGSGSALMIFNDAVMPGLGVYAPSEMYKDVENGVNVRERIRQGYYDYTHIVVYDSGKLNETISADMSYSDLAKEFGAFDCKGAGPERNYFFSKQMDNATVTFFFDFRNVSNFHLYTENGRISSDNMKTLNPSIGRIEVKKEKTTSSGTGTETGTVYHNAKYGWSVDIPEEWYQYGIVKEHESSAENYLGAVGFYYKEAYGTNYGGHVFTIYAMPNNSKRDDGKDGGMPSGGFLGRDSQYAYYWSKATDVQYDYNGSNGKKQSAEYKALSDMRQTILDSFKING